MASSHRFARRLPALTVYVLLRATTAFFFSLVFVAQLVYYVERVGLDPLQMVLVGTILEGAVFLFEIPTGILADLKSRRLSLVIGYALIGIGFLVEGAIAAFWAVALAQVLWGLGYTFTSGATQAWISDEIGSERAGEAFVRGSQAGQLGGLVGIIATMALGSLAIQAPILLGGGLFVALAGWLALVMPEAGFSPTPRDERADWGSMWHAAREVRAMTRRQPQLLLLLGIGLFYGLYSEGFDRLWNAHLLRETNFSALAGLQPVVWMGLIQVLGSLLSIVGAEWARRHVDTTSNEHLGRTLAIAAAGIIVGIVAFGLTRFFWVAIPLRWGVNVLRAVSDPLRDAWMNRQIDDSQVRATVFSVGGQADAIGQVAAGPVIGAIGKAFSTGTAIALSALLLSPVLPLYARALGCQRHPARITVSE